MKPNPEFQIIIPVFQGPNILDLCLKSLLQTITMPTHIILIDDGSPNTTKSVIAKYSSLKSQLFHFTILCHDRSVGCPKSINEGIRISKPEGYTVFVDSDVIFTSKWQEKIHITLQNEPSIGGLGGVLLYPQTGGIQNCGICYHNFLARHIYLNNNLSCLEKIGKREVQATVFAFFATRGSLVKQIGMVDEGFFNGYEDVDFQMRIRELGYKIVVDPQITIYHWEKSNGIHRTFSRRQNLGRFWARNHSIIHNDYIDYLLPQIQNEAHKEFHYIGIDMSESRNDTVDIWNALRTQLSIKYIEDISADCAANQKLWLPELLSSDFFCVQSPLIILCDNFTQLTENRYWFGQRLQYCMDDIVIDLYANVLPIKKLEHVCWPGNKIR